MKKSQMNIARIIAGFCLILGASVQAQETFTRYNAQPTGSTVKIEGTSTLHDWVMEGHLMGGYVELDPGFDAAPKAGKVNIRALVSIPVRSLNSGKSEMDNVMLEAMKQKIHPKIEYHLAEMVLKEAPKTPESPLQFDTKGELIVAGVTNKITMPVTMERIDKTKLKFKGSTPIKMTDYGVTPPVKFGVFRTGNDIKIVFEWLVAQRGQAAK